MRDRIVDFVRERAAQTELPAARLVAWIGISASKFYDWKRRYGRVNEHNAWIPRDHWLEDWEKRAVIDFYQAHPDDGYRRVTYMMMDADIVAVCKCRQISAVICRGPVAMRRLRSGHSRGCDVSAHGGPVVCDAVPLEPIVPVYS